MRTATFFLLVGVFACATPSERVDLRAAESGWTKHEIAGVGFVHAIYSKSLPESPATLHVYIAGDGSPKSAARHNPPDPTPAGDPTFELMMLDTAPSILLGRPCHHITGACDPLHFSVGRYGEPVVASMAVALHGFIAEQGLPAQTPIVLIGFSGGGTIAALLAERLSEATVLVTLAANLDPDAWARHHGHPPLIYSLNPSDRPSLRVDLRQLHLRGGRDKNVLPSLGRAWIDRQPDATERVFADYDHACCWNEIWPRALDELLEADATAETEGMR